MKDFLAKLEKRDLDLDKVKISGMFSLFIRFYSFRSTFVD